MLYCITRFDQRPFPVPPAAKRAFKLSVKVFAGLLGILVLSLGILLWRLASSPIQLDYVTSKAQQAVSNLPGGFSLKLNNIEIYWNRDGNMIDMRAVDVTLLEPSGSPIVSTPEVDISLSIRALMNRIIALSSFDLKNVRVQMLRMQDGSLRIMKKQSKSDPALASETDDSEVRDLTEIVRHSLMALESNPDPKFPLSYLEKIEIDGALEFEDRKTGLDWRADAIDFLFTSDGGPIKGALSFALAAPDAFSGISADVALTASGDDIDASLNVVGVRPAGFVQIDPRLSDLAGMDLTFGGTISTAITLPDTIHKLEVDIKSGAGQLSHDQFYPELLPVRSFALRASADLPAKSLELSELKLSLGEQNQASAELQANGHAKLGQHAVTLQIKALLEQLEVDSLGRYWPHGVVPGARNWLVKNLGDGVVDKASLNLGMKIPIDPEGSFRLNELNGILDYRDLAVSYFGSLPAATGVSGSGTYNRHGFDLGIHSGQVNGLAIGPGRVLISGLDESKAAISVEARLEGELAAAYSVLELPPFDLDGYTGIHSDRLGGRIESDFTIALPLKSGLGKEEISYRADGTIFDGEVQELFREFSVRAAILDLHVDQTKLKFEGSLEFAGIPLTLDWNSRKSEGGMVRDVSVKAPAISAQHIGQFGFPTRDYFGGSMALDVLAKMGAGDSISASFNANLTAAQLAIPEAHWSKNAGDSAGASFIVDFNHDLPVSINDIRVDAGTLESKGRAEFDRTTSRLGLKLDHLVLEKSRLEDLQLTLTPDEGLRLSVKGGELDLEPFLAHAQNPKAQGAETQGSAQQHEPTSSASKRLMLDLDSIGLDRLYFDSTRYFENIQFKGLKGRDGWQEISLSGHNPFTEDYSAHTQKATQGRNLESGQFMASFGPSGGGRFPLKIEIENLGSILSVVEGKQDYAGGYLVIAGYSTGPLLTRPIHSTIEMDAFTLVNAPIMAQVLNLASLSQLLTSLNHEGLAFTSLSGDLVLDGSRLSTEHIRALGGSMGVTARGWADLAQQSMDFSGAVLPLYKMGDFVGKIPVLGKIMVGEDGEGIVAMDYQLQGSFAQPGVTVQPGSLLTPGVFRNILDTGEEVLDEETP